MRRSRSLGRKRDESATSGGKLSVTVELPRELVAAIDRWSQAMQVPGSKAIRRLLEQALAGEPRSAATRAAAGSRHAGAAYAEKAAGDAIDHSFKDSGHSERVKASRKKRLTTIPSELSHGRVVKRPGARTESRVKPRR